MAARLQQHYDVLFIGKDGNFTYCNAFCLGANFGEGSFKLRYINLHYKVFMLFCFFPPGYCAHEFIVDAKDFKKYGIEAIDIAKRLQDYGKRKRFVPN